MANYHGGAFHADAGAGTVGVAGAGWAASSAGLSDITGLVEVDEDGNRHINRGAAGLACLRAASGAMSGMATFGAGATAGAGAISGAGLGLLGDAVGGGLNAYDAQKCKARIRQVLEKVQGKIRLGGPPLLAMLEEVLEFIIGQQKRKRNKGLARASIVGQPGVALYKAGRGIYKFAKGKKGAARRQFAETLMELSQVPGEVGELAREAVQALVMKNYEQIITGAIADAMKTG